MANGWEIFAILSAKWGEKFSDIQCFLDERPQSSRLGDLPKAPIWYELRNLMCAAGLFNPSVSHPSRTHVLYGKPLSHISSNSLILAVTATCFILPIFHPKNGEGEMKETQTKALIWVLAKTQTDCAGCLNRAEFPGIEFLDRIASECGAALIFSSDQG